MSYCELWGWVGGWVGGWVNDGDEGEISISPIVWPSIILCLWVGRWVGGGERGGSNELL